MPSLSRGNHMLVASLPACLLVLNLWKGMQREKKRKAIKTAAGRDAHQKKRNHLVVAVVVVVGCRPKDKRTLLIFFSAISHWGPKRKWRREKWAKEKSNATANQIKNFGTMELFKRFPRDCGGKKRCQQIKGHDWETLPFDFEGFLFLPVHIRVRTKSYTEVWLLNRSATNTKAICLL